LKISQKRYAIGKFHGDFRDQQQKLHKKHSKVFKKQNHCCTMLFVVWNSALALSFQLVCD